MALHRKSSSLTTVRRHDLRVFLPFDRLRCFPVACDHQAVLQQGEAYSGKLKQANHALRMKFESMKRLNQSGEVVAMAYECQSYVTKSARAV